MTQSRAALRYAQALLGLAEEMKKIEEVDVDLQKIQSLAGESRDLHLFLLSPVVNGQKKKSILLELFKGKLSELTMNFVLLLVSKGREDLLLEIITQFQRLRDEHLGILNITLRAAVTPTPEQERRLIQQLEQRTKKKIRTTTLVDTSLKGGFIIQYDDTVWDASVRHQLDLLRRRLVEQPV